MSHAPVLLHEVVTAMKPQAGETYVDGTFGGGGYTKALFEAAECEVIGIDRDLDAIARAEQLAMSEPGLTPLMGRFGEMDSLLGNAGIAKVDGIMLDIGVSSFQIDEADRGFSFLREGPLDMRMGRSGPSAADIVNNMPGGDLMQVIGQLGEEKQARRITKAITDRRALQPFERTLDLAQVIEEALGGRRGKRTHPATLTFQAIRMYVNDELGELARGLAAAETLLKPGGRLAVVTFHSLEDRLVKQFMRIRSGDVPSGSRYRPEKQSGPSPSFSLPSRKAVEPGEAEIAENPRARSARLRLAVRTDADAWDVPVDTGIKVAPLKSVEAAA